MGHAAAEQAPGQVLVSVCRLIGQNDCIDVYNYTAT